jgi:hypothetical protein
MQADGDNGALCTRKKQFIRRGEPRNARYGRHNPRVGKHDGEPLGIYLTRFRRHRIAQDKFDINDCTDF